MATRRTKIFWLMMASLATFLFIVITITGVVYQKQSGAWKTNPAFSIVSRGSQYDVNTLKNSNFLLNLGVGYTKFAPDKGLTVEVGFAPANNLKGADGDPTSFVCVSYRDTDLEFKAKEEMGSESVTVPMSGDTNLFPFDFYFGTLILQAHSGKDNTSCSDPLNINPVVLGTTQGFVVNAVAFPGFNDDGSRDYSSVHIDFTARRIRVHQGFSCLIFIVMWGLTCMLSYICCWTWKGGKRVELGIVAMTAALLYALPRVRDSQPGIPKMGIVQDMVGYCWNVLIIACCQISLLVNFILRKERKKQFRRSKEDGSSLLMSIEEFMMDGPDEVPP